MNSKRITVWPAALLLAVTGAFASPARAAGPMPSPSPGLRSAVHPVTCVKRADGRLADCPSALPQSKLPGGAKNHALVSAAPANPAQIVDTRTWTTGGGNTFPGADVPYGMVQWSPDTLPNRNAGGGYNFGDEELTGYSLTHVSGPGCGAAGDVPILPLTGALPTGDPNEVTTSFTNTGEVAQAGYYSAQSNLPDTIKSEFTETPHSAMGRFTFPATTQAGMLLKLMDSQNTDTAASAQIVGTNEIQGSDTSGDFCGDGQHYTVYFDIVFDRSFTSSQVITQQGHTSPDAVSVGFDTSTNRTIQAKVGISYVSTANARLNRVTESPAWNFTQVKTAAQASWNSLLGRIQVSGADYATTQQFYSLLYKVFLQPNITSDVNGQYMGSDVKVHKVSGKQRSQYGMFSGWDTYHSAAQLQAMLTPTQASDQAQSQLNYYKQNGIIQQWGYLHLDNWVMAGDPGTAIIADYYAFGARGFDTKTALADMLKQATTVNHVRPGAALEQKYGYLPENGAYGCCNAHGQVSSLLEYDSADFALAQFARALGDTKNAAALQKRANNWVNVFDGSTGLLTPRTTSGTFLSGIGPTTTAHYIEGDAYQYLWDVPNNYAGLFSLLGGNAKVKPMLEKFLSRLNGYGMYGQLTNEFGLGEQNALDYAGDPAGTQQAVNNMRNGMYLPGPSGLPNNDDLGAMSSTYVWAMLGMYPENPGSQTLVFASPAFPHAAIHLPNGKTVTINAPGASPTNFYVKSMKINGTANSKLYVSYGTLAKGATLDWKLGGSATSWGSAAADAPPSYGPVYAYTAAVSPASVDLRPGGTVTVTLTVTSLVSAAHSLTWKAVSNGVTASPASGTLTVPANGSASTKVTLTAGDTDGSFPVSFDLSSTAGSVLPAPITVIVARPGDLVPFYDNTGISDDDSSTPANFDGDGWSYSRQALATAGLTAGGSVTSGGITYTWPNVAAGRPDNLTAGGQTIPVSAPSGATKLGFLGSAYNAGSAGSSGTATVTYTDGSTSTATFGFSDWTLSAGAGTPKFGNVIVATTPYRNGTDGTAQKIKTYVFAETVPLDAGKTVTSVTLPATLSQGSIGVFAISAG
jgi:predicted alpha-1,2-mannosidase